MDVNITLKQYIEQLYKASEAKIFYFADGINNDTSKYYERVGYALDEFDYHSTESFLYNGLIYPALEFITGDIVFAESSRFVYLKDCIWMAQAMLSVSSDETPIVIISQKFLSLCHFYVQSYYMKDLDHKEILQKIVRCVYPTSQMILFYQYTPRILAKNKTFLAYMILLQWCFTRFYMNTHIFIWGIWMKVDRELKCSRAIVKHTK